MKSSTNPHNFRYFKDSKSDRREFSSRQDARKSSNRVNRTKTRSKSLKKQIRDTQRLLFKNILDGDALTAQQEKLERLKKCHLEEKQARSRSKRLKKYRGVKYFDSKKVLKKLTSLTKQINTEPNSDINNKTELEREYNLYKRYLNYTTYFPPDKKYLSLFPNSERLDPLAQGQIDTLIHEVNSKVEAGLLDDSWDARLASTDTSLPLRNSERDVESGEVEATVSPNNSDDNANSPPDFIPILSDNRKKTPVGVEKKRAHKTLSFDTEDPNSIPDTSWSVIEPPHDSSTNQMEFEDNLKCDSFFFFDNKGSDIDTSIFNRRPQKKNFQENRNQTDNKNNSKQKSKYQQHKK